MVFCEARCRHGQACDVLIAVDKDHPYEGSYLLHTATDHARREVHVWKSRYTTVSGKGHCEVTQLATVVTARLHGP